MIRRLVLVAFPALLLSACTVATMELSPELAGSEPMLVTGSNPRIWNRPLAFGSFRTEQVSEGGEWRWSTGLLGADVGVAWQRYRLLLGDGDNRVQTECKRRKVFIEKNGLEVDPSLGTMPVLQCALRPEDGGEAWVLTLHRSGPRFSGTLAPESGTGSFEVSSDHRAAGAIVDSVEPVGYVFERDGRAIAAVESINRGRVWIASEEPEERLRSAAAAAALLLFDPEV